MQKSNCTETCRGIIKEIKIKGIDFPSKIIVEFEVSGRIYEISENLVTKPQKIKLGFIPIGYKTKSLIEIKTGISATVGNNVNVKYNADNPNEAYLPDNDSNVTW